MAEKEASVFMIDLGQSMSRKRHDREQSDLDYSLQYVWDKITNIIYLGRKGLFVGVIGFRTNTTKNDMQDEGGYENITVIQTIQNMEMQQLKRLPDQLVPSRTDSGDALSAVILGVDMIMKHCRHLKFTKRLYLITNASGALDPDDIEQTAAQIKQNDIQLTVLGIDFDDPEYGFKEENKPFQKQQNEESLKRLVDLSSGVYATMQEAIEGLARPHVKLTKPIPSYKGQLRLGDPANYDTAITIDIERYPKVMIRRPPTASSYVFKEGVPSQQPAETDGDNLATVRNAYTYSVVDPEAPSGKKDVPREDLAKGYEYGRTAVHISEADEAITKLNTEQSYEIIGFLPQENVERYIFLGPTHMIVSQKLNDKAAYALSSLIHALFEVGSVAVARLVKKDMSEPQLVLLSPMITEDIECLIENDVPFAEDLRTYRFPPIDRIITVSGKHLTTHRNLPNDELLSAMSDFVDGMTLVNSTTKEEQFSPEDVFSPVLHTIEGAIKHRAVYPRSDIPPKSEVLLEYSRPPPDLLETNAKAISKLIKIADVKKVPPKVKGRARYRNRETEKPISGLDVDALLKKGSSSNTQKSKNDNAGRSETEKPRPIDPKNAIPEFKRILHSTDSDEIFADAVKQMGSIIRNLITHSLGDQNYGLAQEMLGVVRNEMVDYEMAGTYNELIKEIKGDIIVEKLGGDRREFWWRVRIGRLGLVETVEEGDGGVSKEEAGKFLGLGS